MKSILYIVVRKDMSLRKKVPKLFQNIKSERDQTFDVNLEKIMYNQEVEGGKGE